jgi:hypothetical protein
MAMMRARVGTALLTSLVCIAMLGPAYAQSEPPEQPPVSGTPQPEAGEVGEPIELDDVPPLPTGDPYDLPPTTPEGSFSQPPPISPDESWASAPFDPEEAEVVDELTTPTRVVYENPNGSFTSVNTADPVRYQTRKATGRTST